MPQMNKVEVPGFDVLVREDMHKYSWLKPYTTYLDEEEKQKAIEAEADELRRRPMIKKEFVKHVEAAWKTSQAKRVSALAKALSFACARGRFAPSISYLLEQAPVYQRESEFRVSLSWDELKQALDQMEEPAGAVSRADISKAAERLEVQRRKVEALTAELPCDVETIHAFVRQWHHVQYRHRSPVNVLGEKLDTKGERRAWDALELKASMDEDHEKSVGKFRAPMVGVGPAMQ